jgi:hypothetical protein
MSKRPEINDLPPMTSRKAGVGTSLASDLRSEVNGMRRARSWIGAAAGLLVLAGTLAIIDERVRHAMVNVVNGTTPSGEIAAASQTLEDSVTLVLQAVRDQSIEHAPLTLFAIGAMALVLFMTRT